MDKEKQAETCDDDVFMSFRGVDTRDRFTDVLYHKMIDAGIRVSMDEDELTAG